MSRERARAFVSLLSQQQREFMAVQLGVDLDEILVYCGMLAGRPATDLFAYRVDEYIERMQQLSREQCRRLIHDFLHVHRSNCNRRSFARGVNMTTPEFDAFMDPLCDPLLPDETWTPMWARCCSHMRADASHPLHTALMLTQPSPLQRSAQTDPRIVDAADGFIRAQCALGKSLYAIRQYVRPEDGEIEVELEFESIGSPSPPPPHE